MTLDELKATLDTFSPVQVEFVARTVESLASPPSADVRAEGTWLTDSEEWIEYFGLALSVHHGTTTEPLGLTSFENVFRNACAHMNWFVDKPGSATRRFVDVVVQPDKHPERRLSLKSTAAKSQRMGSLHISKLTEAAWIQDVRTAKARRQRLLELFRDYQDAVTHIVMLRAFRKNGETPHLYQLVEIPASIFDSIQSARLKDFNSDAPKIGCLVRGEVAALIAIDRSDAKITVRNVKLSACTVHAEWSIEKRSA